ncbi:HU family DNA-binding protein [Hyphomicrobiales bacterium]|nr:HU family DNA-binding protein [Hyphomicrobiales bacterium]CAH1671788.1 HU family DNA-binding protein [Hyphomicrobiales bacterium]
MNKIDLSREVAAITGLSATQADSAVDALSLALRREFIATGNTYVPGIGRLTTAERGERQGRNPRTGEPVTIPKRKVVKFKAKPDLVDAIQ